MKTFKYIFGFLCCALWMWCLSCSKDGEDKAILEVQQQMFTVGSQGGTIHLEIQASAEWALQSEVAWCVPSVPDGWGDKEVEVNVKANVEGEDREGCIWLTGQNQKREIRITQEAISLNLDISSLPVEAEGGEFTVHVYSNAKWDIENTAEWVHVSPIMGKDSLDCRLVVDPTTSVKERKTTLYVSSGVVTRQLQVIQAGMEGNFREEGEVRIYREEDAGNPVKLVFLGDGFMEEDLMVGGKYDQAMEEAIEAYFAVEPYKSYRSYFCPYIVYAYSSERGMSTVGSDGKIKVKKNTAFSVNLKEGTTGMNADMDRVLAYARKVSGLETTRAGIIVIANDPRYAGTCHQWSNGQSVSLIPMNRDPQPPGGFDHLVIHEGAGHGFGRLADEYTGSEEISDEGIGELGGWQASGLFLNVTVSRDPGQVYWHDFIGREEYESVGFYEGAYTYRQGVWRCEENCCMINNIFYFSVACRLAIVKRLKDIAGEPFSLEDFIARDVQKAPTAGQLIGSRTFTPLYYPAPTPPVLVKE